MKILQTIAIFLSVIILVSSRVHAEDATGLASPFLEERQAAVRALTTGTPTTPKVLAALGARFAGASWTEQESIAQVLTYYRAAAASAAPPVRTTAAAAIAGNDWPVAELAVGILAAVAPEQVPATVAVLAPILAGDDRLRRHSALAVVEQAGAGAVGLVPSLITSLTGHPDGPLVVSALEAIGPAQGQVVPGLCKALDTPELRKPALHALRSFGVAAVDAVPTLAALTWRLPAAERAPVSEVLYALKRGNLAPEAVPTEVTACTEGGWVDISLTMRDADDPPESVRVVVRAITAPARLMQLDTQRLRVIVPSGTTGPVDVTWVASDGQAESATVVTRIMVKADHEPPHVLAVQVEPGAAGLRVSFDKPVQDTAMLRSEPPLTLGLVRVEPDGKTLLVPVTGLTPGAVYRLTVAGVADRSVAGNRLAETAIDFKAVPLAPGLASTSWKGKDFTGEATAGHTANLDFPDGPQPGVDNYCVRYDGLFSVPVEGAWSFSAEIDDGARLWIDGMPVFDAWQDPKAGNSPAMTLQAGVRYQFRLEFYQGAWGQRLRLFWQGPGQEKTIIPATAFLGKL